MKIAYNLLEGTNSGGIERIVISKANWLVENGHEVTLITTDRKGREPFFHVDERIKWVDLAINYRDDWSSTLRKMIMRGVKMRRHRKGLKEVLDKIQPDITISTFGNEAEFLPRIPSAGKTVLEIHFSRYFRKDSRRKGLQGLLDRIHTYTDNSIVRKFDAFICLTEEDKSLWGALDNIHHIPNFIPAKHTSKASLDNKHAIAAGRLTYQKGYDRMIEAWRYVARRHPDWYLDIYGTGELEGDLKAHIKTVGLEGKVIIHPPYNPIEDKMVESSMLIMSSHYEGLPMVMIEGMGCGLPVVTFDYKCGPRDVLTPECGIITPDGDVKALSEAICRLIENETVRKQMGANAFTRVEEFLPSRVMPQWIRLFESLQTGSDSSHK